MDSYKVIYAFIDSQNLNLAIRDCGWRLDFKKLRIYLKDKYKVEKAFLFIGYIRGNESLYENLKKFGYTLVFKPTLKYRKDDRNYTKGNVDAELVLHSLIQYGRYDQAIIISGDGDFYCLHEYLSEKSKLLKIVIPNPNKYSALLGKFRSYFVFISQLQNKLGINEKKRE